MDMKLAQEISETLKLKNHEALIQKGFLTAEQLEQAKAEQKQSGLSLEQCLLGLNLIPAASLYTLIAEQLNVQFIDLNHFEFDLATVQLLPEAYARRFHALVLEQKPDVLIVGMINPADLIVLDQLKRVLKKNIIPVLIAKALLMRTINLVYRRTEEIKGFAQKLNKELQAQIGPEEGSGFDVEVDEELDAPVNQLLQSIFEDAVQINASDIHIEPGENLLRIRQRIDGILHEHVMEEKGIAEALTLRLKLMAGLNISEKRLPQDGRFSLTVHDKKIDVRLSTLPTYYGESTVMRLLDQSGGIVSIDSMGMLPDMYKRFEKLLEAPHGLILVTGPTGSGKSTTLYAALTKLNEPGVKIITVEDPVEYRLQRLNQVQINPKIDLTFARVLRTTLRQDPDIILVGEMRDFETADIAMKAALTGHLVLSTLHTNSAISSAMRLLDMGEPGFVVAAALLGVLAQRLIRLICQSCKQPYQPTDREKTWMKEVFGQDFTEIQFMHGTGCAHCNHMGYRGRRAVFELLELNSAMMDALRQNDTVAFSHVAAEAMKGKLLVHNAFVLAQNGDTTIEEVMRIASEQ